MAGGIVELDFQKISARLDQLKSRRANWDSHWQKVEDLIWPNSGGFTTDRSPGERTAQRIFDSTASLDLEKFAAVLEFFLTPRGGKWHKLVPSIPELRKDNDVKRWFDRVNEILFTVRNEAKAAYYSQKHEGYKSLGAFGNECLFIDANPEGGIRYKNCHVGRVYVEVNQHGLIDTIFFLFPLSAKAALQQFGSEVLMTQLPKVFNMLDKLPFNETDFLHIVSPRTDRDSERIDPLNKPWQSIMVGMESAVSEMRALIAAARVD